MEAVNQKRCVLRYASEREALIEAVEENVYSYYYASDKPKKEKDFRLEI